MKKRMNFVLFLLWAGSLLHAQENTSSLFDQGNAYYNEANYAEAVNSYKQVLQNGLHSAELYYNLGSAYYRLNQVAESIYYFEKAKKLDPKNEDIKINSSFAQNMTIDAAAGVPNYTA
jgi:tetratricopeptide (TPR) repeat protein